jgi:hypothetical protein
MKKLGADKTRGMLATIQFKIFVVFPSVIQKRKD